MTNISEMDFTIKVNSLKEDKFSPMKYDQENNNSCNFAIDLIMYLLEIDHLEPELLEYLQPFDSP